MSLLLLAIALLPARAAEPVTDTDAGPDLPDVVAQDCTVDPRARTGLVHLRCGPSRLLVAQLHDVEGDMHDEILESVLELVPPPAPRAEVPLPDDDLRRTRVVQARDDRLQDPVRVHLQLTTRRSTGRSVACVVGLADRRRADKRELDWCETVTTALLPPPPDAAPTRITVQEPDLPQEGLAP